MIPRRDLWSQTLTNAGEESKQLRYATKPMLTNRVSFFTLAGVMSSTHMFRFTINRHPVALPRPRFQRAFQRNTSRGTLRVFTPKVAQKAKADFRCDIVAQANGYTLPAPDKAVTLRIVYRFKRPKAHFRHDGTVATSAPTHHLRTPDLDNLVKFTLDTITGPLIHDDKQVAVIKASKIWDDRNRAENAASTELRVSWTSDAQDSQEPHDVIEIH